MAIGENGEVIVPIKDIGEC